MMRGSRRIMSFTTLRISHLNHRRWMGIGSIFKTTESPLKGFFYGAIIMTLCLHSLRIPQMPLSRGAILRHDTFGNCTSKVRDTVSRNVSSVIPLSDNTLLNGCFPCLLQPSPHPHRLRKAFYSPWLLCHARLFSGPLHSETTVLNQ